MPAVPSASPCCRWTPRSKWTRSSRCADVLVPVPPQMLDRLEQFDPATAAVPKDAATIAVVRDGDRGLEAFLMRRHSGMAFAAGMYVFPGGGVQDDDGEPMVWVGPPAQAWASRFSCTPDLAHRLVVA